MLWILLDLVIELLDTFQELEELAATLLFLSLTIRRITLDLGGELAGGSHHHRPDRSDSSHGLRGLDSGAELLSGGHTRSMGLIIEADLSHVKRGVVEGSLSCRVGEEVHQGVLAARSREFLHVLLLQLLSKLSRHSSGNQALSLVLDRVNSTDHWVVYLLNIVPAYIILAKVLSNNLRERAID